ncbi:MAG: LuxR family transcriptional regulator, partial [Candidatus Dormibacteraeota bacterium]|nr:LuxR family transcriptional regulator [Candidatus Dormibacteraeota bacterium]
MGETAARTNLPLQLTSFVGREAELEGLHGLLRESRLVTVAGVSGMGKTRLAIELGERLLPTFPGGCWFVALASLNDPALIPQTVAEAIGTHDEDLPSLLRSLSGYFTSGPGLLILDNCEHVIDSSARLVESALRASPALSILATSHEPLRVPGEAVWRIAGLATPATKAGASATEAVRLFAARAALGRPSFSLSPARLETVTGICRSLDGIPLAIELAAARVEMMSVEDILERLTDSLRLLTGGSRTGLSRHQTLRAALDWGHHLLDQPEQVVFRRLAVMSGGFDVAAAEAVCGDRSAGLVAAGDVVAELTRLVDKSLVAPEPETGGPTRYRMLETVRQYAAERLLESGEADQARFRHAQHFVALAELAEKSEFSAAQATWLDRLETDHGNLRATLE